MRVKRLLREQPEEAEFAAEMEMSRRHSFIHRFPRQTAGNAPWDPEPRTSLSTGNIPEQD